MNGHELCSEMRLLKIKHKTKKVLAASACTNYDQKLKGNKANTCAGNFLSKDLGCPFDASIVRTPLVSSVKVATGVHLLCKQLMVCQNILFVSL